jgi:hypothetical protein
MFHRCVKRLMPLCWLAVWSATLSAQSQSDKDSATSFLSSAAATIYNLAFPTATYKKVEFGGFELQRDGIAVTMKLSGVGMLGDNLWVRLGMGVGDGRVKDFRVIDHDALLAPPFATTAALARGLVELNRSLSQSTEERVAPPLIAAAICIINMADMDLVFSYSWGGQDWKAGAVKARAVSLHWWQYGEDARVSPNFYIRYDDDLSPRYNEQAYRLERKDTTVPVNCEGARKYRFSLNGHRVLLTAA